MFILFACDLFPQVEDILSKSRYLCGDRFTEADVRLFTTLVRFDPVYVGHFKVKGKRHVTHMRLYRCSGNIFSCN